MSECYASELVKVAKKELGYIEKKTRQNLSDKKANAGYNDWNKYAEFFDKNHPEFYNGAKNGFWWCDIFVDWCFIKAFGYEKGRQLLCQPLHSCGAGCTYSAQYYKDKGQFYPRSAEPKVGDQIFFGQGEPYHTGIVVQVDKTYVYTIEGNTSSSSVVVANGGCVAAKTYVRTYSEIYGYGRPKFDKEPVKKKKKYYKLINRTGLYKKAYKDIVGGTSVPEKYLDKGTTIEWISDDNFGWSKIKYRGTSYYIFNSHIPDEKLSPCKSGVVLNADTFGYRVYKDGHKGSRKQFRKGQKFTAICVIEEGKYKDWTYVRINSKKYYLKAKLL